MIRFALRPLNSMYKVLLCICATVLLYACNQPTKTPVRNKDTVAKTTRTPANMPVAKKVATDTTATTDCPREAAEPVIKKDVFPGAHFALQPDLKTGIETLTFTDGDKVTIRQSGCEYYILSFRFETSRFMADTTDVPYWSSAAYSFMRKLSKGLDTPLEIGEVLNKLSARVEKDKTSPQGKLKLGEEIDFGGPDPRQYLTIDRISRLADQRYSIELSLSYGPI